jgi:hypothetical protein
MSIGFTIGSAENSRNPNAIAGGYLISIGQGQDNNNPFFLGLSSYFSSQLCRDESWLLLKFLSLVCPCL